MDLNTLRDEALQIAVAHGFTEATPAEDIALMHSELSEALEDIRMGLLLNELTFDHTKMLGLLAKPCGVPSEMADVIIWVLHFCGRHKIDIQAAVANKMAYNNARPYRHGGKAL